jgi:nitrogenase molybdenum-iron protein alpha/beta subunit
MIWHSFCKIFLKDSSFLTERNSIMSAIPILKEREDQIWQKGDTPFNLTCDKHSLAGSISQRACVFCGSRVVLYPIADAVHLVHGPIGCAAYTWDIRGALSSGPELHRLSFSTDLREKDVIFGGEKKLYSVLNELIDRYQPKAAFVYSTCIVGIIGDDVQAVCRRLAKEKGIPVLPVNSEGFKGTKKDGYKAACEALFQLIGSGNTDSISKYSINILGEFNVGGAFKAFSLIRALRHVGMVSCSQALRRATRRITNNSEICAMTARLFWMTLILWSCPNISLKTARIW